MAITVLLRHLSDNMGLRPWLYNLEARLPLEDQSPGSTDEVALWRPIAETWGCNPQVPGQAQLFREFQERWGACPSHKERCLQDSILQKMTS